MLVGKWGTHAQEMLIQLVYVNYNCDRLDSQGKWVTRINSKEFLQ